MTAPAELNQIGLDASKFHKVRPNEFHGPCRCGGNDRLSVKTDRPFPHYYLICRQGPGHCGFSGWADEYNEALRTPISDEQRAIWKAQRQAQDEADARIRAQRLATFTDTEIFAECHARMNAANRAWWERQGLPATAQDYWGLGYKPNTTWGEAYTIPFSAGGSVINMQYRLLHPPEENNKYRWAGLGYSSFFTAHPDTVSDVAYICEGAKKAMVYAYHIAPDTQQVYAVPSKSDFASIAAAMSEHGRVWIILDPDAKDKAMELAREIGSKARIVELPRKLDDAIIKHGYTTDKLRKYFRQSLRAS